MAFDVIMNVPSEFRVQLCGGIVESLPHGVMIFARLSNESRPDHSSVEIVIEEVVEDVDMDPVRRQVSDCAFIVKFARRSMSSR